jgi:guanylate kinase
LSQGKVVILEIDVQGAKKIKKVLDPSIPLLSIFVLPPSIKVLRERLEGRKTETPEQIQTRIEVAQEEIKEAGAYDKAVVNQNLDQTVVEIEGLILDCSKKTE